MLLFNKSYSFDDESEDDWSDSGYAGTCNFPFRFYESVGCVGDSVGSVSGMGSSIFSLSGIESIGDVFLLVVFIPKEIWFKGGRLIEIFWRPKSLFSLLVSKSVFEL